MTGETAEVSKSQPAIALKATTAGLVEKLISFQDLQFQHTQNGLIGPIVQTRSHHLRTSPDNWQTLTVRSKEFTDLVDFYKKRVFWQEGRYEVKIQIYVLDRKDFDVVNAEFSLTGNDVERLNRNVSEIERDLTSAISPPPKEQQRAVYYDYVAVNLKVVGTKQ